MNEVLSQDEIDQLLTAISSGDSETDEFKPVSDTRKIKIYDFKRPDKFSKEQLRTVSNMHETFARLTTTSLSAQLRSLVHVHVASVDQLTYEEFIRSIPSPTTLAVVNMDPLKGNAVLEIDPSITFCMIDRLFGGRGVTANNKNNKSRDLTDIEQSVMEGIIVRVLANMREAWTQVIDLRPRLGQIETNPQFAQIVPPSEMVVLITLETKVGDEEGMLNFGYDDNVVVTDESKNEPARVHETNSVRNTPRENPKTEIKFVDKPQRHVVEIKVYYDDFTYESFYPAPKK